MPAALGPRFVLEAGFLILLAVVVGLADLRPALIILVMAIGWLLVSLIEYLAWRQRPGFAAATRSGAFAEPAPAAQEIVQEEVVEEAPPPPAPPPSPTEEETVIEPGAAPPDEAEERAASRPRRRWIVFGPRKRLEDSSEEER
jgi:hypothetical protein